MRDERRIIFPSRQDEAATIWLHSQFWELAEKGDIQIRESVSAGFGDQETKVGDLGKVRFEIDLDRPRTDMTTWQEIDVTLSLGKGLEVARLHSYNCENRRFEV